MPEESLLSTRDSLSESLATNKDSHNKPKTPNPLKESPFTQAYQITQASKSSGGGGYNELLPLRGLDFGCGIGRQSILMSEFKIQSFGIDIAQNALTQAKALAKKHNANVDFRLYDGQHIPFEDEFFDFTLSYGVLDSLPFSLAQSLMKEIARVSKTYFFCSLIGEQSTSGFSNIHTQSFNGEIEVQEAHERGTIQSFFDYEKILKLFSNTSFEIISLELKSYLDILKNTTQSRYYIVCKKANI
ncbi:class I SAM-dependent methyltransferase [Helicobacter marmotae]|uniref:Class I SAM-dependent methyltransferase n=3 Tax=Helicobacter marmotae TaxID=152490 RepID=A0A3D8I6M1_9HELI|nr:class I SAM-dependent methyltransferase [Helicobacter marmotae]